MTDRASAGSTPADSNPSTTDGDFGSGTKTGAEAGDGAGGAKATDSTGPNDASGSVHVADKGAIYGDASAGATDAADSVVAKLGDLNSTDFENAVKQGVADINAGKHVTFQIDADKPVLDVHGNPIPVLDDSGNPVITSGKPVYQTQANYLYDQLAKADPSRDFQFAKGGDPFNVLTPDHDFKISTTENPLTFKTDTVVSNAAGETVNVPPDTMLMNGGTLDGNSLASADPNVPLYAKTPTVLNQESTITLPDGSTQDLPKGTSFWSGDKQTLKTAVNLNGDTISSSSANSVYAKTPDGQLIKLSSSVKVDTNAIAEGQFVQLTKDGTGSIQIDPANLTKGADVGPGTSLPKLLVRMEPEQIPGNVLDVFGNSQKSLEANNIQLPDGQWAPKAGAMRDHFDLWQKCGYSCQNGQR